MNKIPKNTTNKTLAPLKTKRNNYPLKNYYPKNKLELSPKEDALFLSSLETLDPEKMIRINKYASFLFRRI